MATKKLKKYTEADYLFNPIMEMIEEGDGLEEFPGCCGINVLHGFSDADRQIGELVRDANEIEQKNVGTYYDQDVPEQHSAAGVKSELLSDAKICLATTIPSQKYAIKALTALGFEPLEVFKGNSGNRVTLWCLRK